MSGEVKHEGSLVFFPSFDMLKGYQLIVLAVVSITVSSSQTQSLLAKLSAADMSAIVSSINLCCDG